MKIFTRNGRSFKITEELYKKLKTVKLFEDGDLSANPQSQATSQSNPQQPAQPNPQQSTQPNNDKNNGDMEQLDYKIEQFLIRKLQNNLIDTSNDSIKSEVKTYISHMSADDKKKFATDKEFNDTKCNELIQTLNKKYPKKSTKLSSTLTSIISGIYKILSSTLNDFNEHLTQEINNKLNRNYETIELSEFIISGLPKIKDLVNELKEPILKKFDPNYGEKPKRPELKPEQKLVDRFGNPLNMDEDYETDDFIKDKDTYIKVEKFIKDVIYEKIVSKLNTDEFKKNTLKQSKELGEEWVNNVIEKVINVIKYAIYNGVGGTKMDFGDIDIHNYTTDQYDEIWDKLKDKIKSSQPTNEIDETFKMALLKMFEIVDNYETNTKEEVKEAKNQPKKEESPALKEKNALKKYVFRIYNDYTKTLNIGKNMTSTRKVNKNFVMDIINPETGCMKEIEKWNNYITGIKNPNNSNISSEKIGEVANFINETILDKYVFNKSVTTDANYDVEKYTTLNKDGKNKKVKEVFSVKNKYNIVILTEEKKKEVSNADQLKNVSLLLNFLKSFEEFIYDRFKTFYKNLDEISVNDNENLYDKLDKVYLSIYNLITPENGYAPVMIFGIVKKVVIVISNFAVNNIDNYVDEKLKKENKETKNPKELKSRALDKFEMYMGRKPLQDDIRLYKETLEKLKNHINQMKDVDNMFVKSAAKRYFYKVTDYYIKTNASRKTLDSDLVSAITSIKRGKGSESEEFLNRCIAYNELGKYYKKVNESKELKANKNNDYFDTLLNKIFEGNDIIDEQMINSLFHEVWITNNNLSSAQLITIMTKNPALKEKYDFNQDYDVTALYSKKPVIILNKGTEEFIGVLSFISLHNLINALKQLSNFDITKITPQFKGRKYT